MNLESGCVWQCSLVSHVKRSRITAVKPALQKSRWTDLFISLVTKCMSAFMARRGSDDKVK